MSYYMSERNDNSTISRVRYKLRFGIIDYPDIEQEELELNTKANIIRQATADGWWPDDGFARQPEYANYLDNEQLLPHQENDLIMRAIILNIQEKGDYAFGWYERSPDIKRIRLRPEIQGALMNQNDWLWLRHLYLVDPDRAAQKINDNTTALLEQEITSGLITRLVPYLPVGHALAIKFLRYIRQCTNRQDMKNEYPAIICKLPKEIIEKEWPEFTDLMRTYLINRPDLSDKLRMTAFRCMLRERPSMTVKAPVPWNYIRELQADLLPIAPHWLHRENIQHMTGNPVTLAEFKKLIFRIIVKGANGAKRRLNCDAKESVEKYSKLCVSDTKSLKASLFMETLDAMNFSIIKQWMRDCGTETAKELAVIIMTEDLKKFANEQQKSIKTRIDAEPKNIMDYQPKEEANP